MRHLLLFTVGALLQAQPADFASKAEAYVQSFVSGGRFRGAVLVAKDGQPLLRKGYGMANAEWDVPNAPDTKYRIGSITKQFTAMAILQLAEQGKLKLDDPISRHYDSPPAWEKITIHHLLNHTSGIPSYTGLPDFSPDKLMRRRMNIVDIVKLTQDKPLDFEPGSKYRYNNTAYCLLGHLVEKLSGMQYDEYVRTKIFQPAGMADSGYDWPAPLLKKRAAGYSPDGTNAPFLDMSLPHAAGALYSTVDDFLKWDKALHEGKLISKESWTRMTTAGMSDYGYGLVIRKVAGHDSQAHGGGINGFNTMFIRFPQERVAVAVFANINGPAADTMAIGLARMFFGEDVKASGGYTEISMTPEQLGAYPGVYDLMPELRMTVRLTGSQLSAQLTNQPEFPVFPYEKDKFFLKVVDAQVEFVRGQNGKVESAILHQGGRDMPAKRVEDVKPREEFKEITLSPEQLDAFPGVYELAPEFRITVRRREGQLYAQATNQSELPIFPYADNKFFYKAVYAQLDFVRGGNGKVERAVLHQNGRSMPAPRMP